MTNPTGLLIRDGVPDDVPACLALDHTYDTDFVWQVNIHGDHTDRHIHLRQERLPRQMPVRYPATERHLRTAASAPHAFLVATDKPGHTYYGYLALLRDPANDTATLRDVVVGKPYRRAGLATRLLKVARRWANQHAVTRIYAETQTKNHPAIQLYTRAGYHFCGFNDQYFDNQDIAIFFCLTLH